MILCALPQLTHGTLGGRRGPIFMALMILFFGWAVARGKMPHLRHVVVGVLVACVAIIYNASQRKEIYLGSEGSFNAQRFWETLAPERVEPGNTYLTGASGVIVANYFEDYYWGKRFLVTFVIRPIPSFLWPTKYADVGADWVRSEFDKHDAKSKSIEAAGVEWIAGSAMPSIADVYKEFQWGAVPFFLGLGLIFGHVWRKHILVGGYWTILNYLMLMLSIYLASQSFSAWGIRLMIMGVPTLYSLEILGRRSESSRAGCGGAAKRACASGQQDSTAPAIP